MQQNRTGWAQKTTQARDAAPNGEQMSLGELDDRLGRIDPYAMDYGTWLKLIAAIRHCYGDASFETVKAWSDTPGKAPLTEAKWNSLGNQHPRAAGYGTIVQILQGMAS